MLPSAAAAPAVLARPASSTRRRVSWSGRSASFSLIAASCICSSITLVNTSSRLTVAIGMIGCPGMSLMALPAFLWGAVQGGAGGAHRAVGEDGAVVDVQLESVGGVDGQAAGEYEVGVAVVDLGGAAGDQLDDSEGEPGPGGQLGEQVGDGPGRVSAVGGGGEGQVHGPDPRVPGEGLHGGPGGGAGSEQRRGLHGGLEGIDGAGNRLHGTVLRGGAEGRFDLLDAGVFRQAERLDLQRDLGGGWCPV